MNARVPAIGFLLSMLTLASAPSGQTRLMPIGEVRPGMVGTGRTVFSGATVEDFQVHILGVLHNVIAPNRDLILARLEGGPLARTGVIAGMSGSPVYIDGRLVGAVSYSLGQFATEPIAGITPIAEMTDAAAMAIAPPATRPVALSWPPRPAELVAVWTRDLRRFQPSAALPGGAMAGLSVASTAILRPITVPLLAGGFEPGVIDALSGTLSAAGFLPMSSQAPAANRPQPPARRTLAPGDAVGVSLLSGDFEMGATGTVTHVDGDRVYAFGHPLYNLGPTEFPMTAADVHVVLPSLMQSSKLASLGPVLGTLQQDRATAIAGRLGPGPSLIPMAVTLDSDRLGQRTFSFGVVRDTTFTPLLAYLAVANVLTAYERATGPASFTIRGTASIRAHAPLDFEEIFTGDQPVGTAAAYVAAPLTLLFKNTSEPVDVERISLTIEASEESRTARIERVWLDTTRPRAGATATVSVALRGARGEERVERVPITFPANTHGPVQLLVADAERASADDRRDLRSAEIERPSQIIRTFNRARRSNRIYVRLTTTDPGAVVSGEPMRALPPSVLSVLESDRSTGSVSTMRSALRGEWEIPLDLAVSGSRQLSVSLDQPE
ncbi:MAG: hypothetical protein IT180_07445 [Acidobacteria bacterium]|nr:hypothetical protein [Acidobacteriota bacterium]